MKTCPYSTDCTGCVDYKDVLLDVRGVNLNYGSKVILRDVNVQVKDVTRKCHIQGQIVGFLGPSGIGKTQLFRIIAGLNKPTSGGVYVNAHQDQVHAGMVGVVAQSYTLFEHRTIIGNLMLAASKKEKDQKVARDKAMAYLERFKMVETAQMYPAMLSGGQRQRIAIAQQLLCSEHFLLLDEPFSGLDPINVDKVCGLLREVSCLDELNTVIIVSHDVASVASVADTLWLMGRDRDAAGGVIPGARIVKKYDLVEMGLCWQEHIQTRTDFATFVAEVKEEFIKL